MNWTAQRRIADELGEATFAWIEARQRHKEIDSEETRKAWLDAEARLDALEMQLRRLRNSATFGSTRGEET